MSWERGEKSSRQSGATRNQANQSDDTVEVTLELKKAVMNRLRTCSISKGLSLFKCIRRAIYEYLDRERIPAVTTEQHADFVRDGQKRRKNGSMRNAEEFQTEGFVEWSPR